MQNERQLVTIKGTNEGFVFELDDEHLFEDVFNDLVAKLSENIYPMDEDNQAVSVIVKLGNRYLSAERKTALQEVIEKSNRFHVERFDTKVVSMVEAHNWLEKSSIKLVNQIVRSGQTLDIVGDLLLIGDVNPGGSVSASGNVFIMGNLHGIAHAGKNGDDDAVIVASYMNPSQLRIGKYISRAPDFQSEGVYMECGYYDKKKKQIVIDRLQVLPFVRKELRDLERRVLNG